MKRREELEIKLYEKLGVKRIRRIGVKADGFFNNVSLALPPKSKRAKKLAKMNKNKFFDSSLKVEGVVKYKRKIKGCAPLSFAYGSMLALAGGLYAAMGMSFLGFAIYFVGAGLVFCTAMAYRYDELRAKRTQEKWRSKYENQKADVISDIMDTNKELGHPSIEIVNEKNKIQATSLCELTSNAELSDLKRYDAYLKSCAEASKDSQPLPTLDCSDKKVKTLRLVPGYAKTRK